MNNIFKSAFYKSHTAFLIFLFCYLVIFLLCIKVPMFWDMSYISRISNLIYDNHFSIFIFDVTDNGATPIYSIYVAILWKIFGKSLFVSHLAILPFTIGILFYFYKISKRFIDKKFIPIALLLLLIEQTIITQTIMAGDDLVYCFLFLLGLNSVFENKRFLIALSMLIIPILNLRGFSIVLSLLLIDFYINVLNNSSIKKISKIIFTYIPTLAILLIWLLYHYYITGWYAVSGSRDKYHHLNGLNIIARNIIYITWKIIDFGRIISIFFIVLFYFIAQKKKDKTGIKLFLLILFSVLPYLLFFISFTYPVSHRHFMITYILGIIFFTYGLNYIKLKSTRIIILIFTSASLIFGNFIIYPERFGNGWDSSLKMLPYFNLKEQLDNYIEISNIAPASVGTKFPMDFDNYDCNLKNKHFKFSELDNEPFDKMHYIVQSNICNTFTPEEIEKLNSKWILVKEFHSCQIYFKLFKNPDHLNEN